MYFKILANKFKKAQSSKRVRDIHPIKSAEFVATRFGEQRFIRYRKLYRWVYHLLLSGGSTLAFSITFPLVFGWLYFDGSADGGAVYKLVAFGISTVSFPVDSFIGWMLFNGLNISGVMALTGVLMASFHRFQDKGLRATTRFYEDWMPLIIIFAVSFTGILLWISAHYLEGVGHATLRWVHFITVALLILFIPYGKLFHIFQRWLSVLVKNHQISGQESGPTQCPACDEPFHYAMHAEDLNEVLNQIGMPYQFDEVNSQHVENFSLICPTCRRRKLAQRQGELIGR